MATHSFDDFFRHLKKGDPAPVYYLVGAEDVLKDEAINHLLDRVLDPSLRDFNLDQRSANQLEPEEVGDLCQTLPMMASHRVVVLRDIEAWKRKTRARKSFLAYLERPNPETVVILVQAAGEEKLDAELAKQSYVVKCDPLRPDRLLSWIEREVGRLEVTLEPGAAEHLVKVVGGDLSSLRGELQKLAGLGAVTREAIGDLVGVRHGETAFDWREAVMDRRPDRALTLLPHVLAQSGVSGVRLVSMLGTTLVGTALARGHYDSGVRGRRLAAALFQVMRRARLYGLGDWKSEADHWTRWAEDWTGPQLRRAISAALSADRALKGTRITGERGVLADLVMQLSTARREAA